MVVFVARLGEDDDEGIVGIWKYDESRRRLMLCWRGRSEGIRQRFDDEERQDLITLWREMIEGKRRRRVNHRQGDRAGRRLQSGEFSPGSLTKADE